MAGQLVAQDVTFAGKQCQLKAYVTHQGGGAPRPAVVVVHEWWGLDDHIRDVGRRFAQEGYFAVAPDLYSRQGHKVATEPNLAAELMGALKKEDGIEDLQTTVEWLRAQKQTQSARIGIIGFCMGGSYALQLPCETRELSAAAPFYGESSMMMYRTDLFQKAGLTMPEQPTWDFVIDAAKKLTDKSTSVYGICLRGKAGWGENMALLTAMSNSYGARWFDEKWQPQFDKPEWKKTLTTYVDLMKAAGPPGASSNGFNENLALFNSGKCAMWVDATVAASFVTNPRDSQVADKVGFALAPNAGLGKNANWLWAWNLAIPAGSKKVAAAEKFIAWATSKDYTRLVASKEGWANVPPGTRTSLYQNAEYLKVAPFAKLTLASIDAADPNKPTVQPVPYVGVQYAAIPEFQGIGTTVGQQFSAALSGSSTVDAALAAAQSATEREMKRAGYIK